MKKIRENIGNFDSLKEWSFDLKKLSKRLLSREFADLPFFRHAVLMASLLDEEFFPNTLILGKAIKQYDLTWLIKDFSYRLDFVSTDFSSFEEEDLYKGINFFQVKDIFSFVSAIKYDLIIVIEDYLYFKMKRESYYNLLSKNISSKESRIIFILINKYNIDLKLDIPDSLIKTFELKFYDKGELKSSDFIIYTKGIVLK